MKRKATYGQEGTAPGSPEGQSASRVAIYIERIEKRNRLIKENKALLVLKEKQIQKERRRIDQLEGENKQDYAQLVFELSSWAKSQNISVNKSELHFDWNPNYDLEVFFKLLTGAIPRIEIVLFPMAVEDFKAAFTPGSSAKSKIDCIDLKQFTDILYVLMRKGIVLINEKLLVRTIMDRCLHNHEPASKTNLQRYTSLSRCSFTRDSSFTKTVREIVNHLKPIER